MEGGGGDGLHTHTQTSVPALIIPGYCPMGASSMFICLIKVLTVSSPFFGTIALVLSTNKEVESHLIQVYFCLPFFSSDFHCWADSRWNICLRPYLSPPYAGFCLLP